jgi:hypothetical protein
MAEMAEIEPAECVIETSEGVSAWTPTHDEVSAKRNFASAKLRVSEITHRTPEEAQQDELKAAVKEEFLRRRELEFSQKYSGPYRIPASQRWHYFMESLRQKLGLRPRWYVTRHR